MWYAGKPIGLGVMPLIAAVWRYILASLLAGMACEAIVIKLACFAGASGTLGAAERVGLISILFMSLYLGAIVILYWGVSPLKRILVLLREMTPVAKA